MNLDFNTFGMKGYSYGVVSLVAFAISFILAAIDINLLSFISGILAFVTALKAYINSKKELEDNIENIKAHYGRRIGLVVPLMQVIYLIVSVIIGIFSLFV